MTKFVDGPAEGVTLRLKYAPLYLRAVRGPMGNWDALDQALDRPEPNETVVVYRRRGEPYAIHVLRMVKGRRECGWYQGAYYELNPVQPDEAVLRDGRAWNAWCAQQAQAPSTSSTPPLS